MLFISAAITGIASALLGWAMDIHSAGGANCHDFGDNCICYKLGELPRTIHGEFEQTITIDNFRCILWCYEALFPD